MTTTNFRSVHIEAVHDAESDADWAEITAARANNDDGISFDPGDRHQFLVSPGSYVHVDDVVRFIGSYVRQIRDEPISGSLSRAWVVGKMEVIAEIIRMAGV